VNQIILVSSPFWDVLFEEETDLSFVKVYVVVVEIYIYRSRNVGTRMGLTDFLSEPAAVKRTVKI
jgi:hypothetical protein